MTDKGTLPGLASRTLGTYQVPRVRDGVVAIDLVK